ncbi:MAG: DUF423 domain-containing protein [Saprospiraceae bacterium]
MNIFYKRLLGIGCLLGATGVIAGAFGAHFLKSRLDVNSIEVIRTGVLYLFIHVLAILFVVNLGSKSDLSRLLRSSGILFMIGIFFFTGSLLFIGTSSLTGLDIPLIGLLTPLGGVCFIAGWVLLSVYSFTSK